jgi:hypothetical protein
MESSELVRGLTPYSEVGQSMLGELVEHHKKLVARSASNQNWTEQTQLEFETVHAIIRRHGVFV